MLKNIFSATHPLLAFAAATGQNYSFRWSPSTAFQILRIEQYTNIGVYHQLSLVRQL